MSRVCIPDGDVHLDLKAVRELPSNAEGYSWAPGEVSHLSRDGCWRFC